QTDPSKCEVFGGNSFENIHAVVASLKRMGEDAYIYIDPPFSYREGMEDIYDKTIHLIENLPREVVRMIIIEHMSTLEIPESIGIYTTKKTKKFGKTSLTYLVENL
ncbi:MAG: RsmD family RNA methyltransferase, partial [Campylobacterales bacterium]|nr:RsmD family RNA methyltransferase [Campylobacterales bacterium]